MRLSVWLSVSKHFQYGFCNNAWENNFKSIELFVKYLASTDNEHPAMTANEH